MGRCRGHRLDRDLAEEERKRLTCRLCDRDQTLGGDLLRASGFKSNDGRERDAQLASQLLAREAGGDASFADLGCEVVCHLTSRNLLRIIWLVKYESQRNYAMERRK